ncbi:Transposon Tf2-6 polyprotein [Formica fusca]
MILGMDFLSEQTATLKCGKNFIVHFPENRLLKIGLNAITIEDAEAQMNKILARYAELFKNEIGCVTHYAHEIKLNSGKPFKAKTYPVPEVHRCKVKEHLLALESVGIIERASTQYVNPLVVVVKKTGEIRLCLDAREVNKKMANDHDQPPTIDEVFRRIGDKKYFSTLDVAKAFWQIPLTADSKQFTGFKFDNQTYIFRRMLFGLKTAGASFTRAMQKAIGDECDSFAIIYLDDILIASSTLEEHLFHLNYVLEKLQSVCFRLNKDKCEFLKTEIKFLGHTFDQVKADMNTDTKLAIQNFERPKNKKALQAFLGLINWDRRFIKNLASMTRPLESLLKKNTKFEWTDEIQRSFVDIKRAFSEAPCLFIIRPGLKFGLYVDASKYGLGARLYQYNADEPDKRYTVAYASRSLKGAEMNYTVTEIECLALVWTLRKWHATLLGRHVKIHSDHRALKFMPACADDSSRIARWMAFLSEFELEICHIPGVENRIADTLSRNNIQTGFIKKEGLIKRVAAIRKPNDLTETATWAGMIADGQREDRELQEQIAETPDELPLRDNLVRVITARGERIVIPEAIKWHLTKKVHEYLLHYGIDKVIDFINGYFVMHNLERVARDVVASCCVCQAIKYYTRPTRGAEYYELPKKPSEVISIDLFGPLPQTSRGNKYILVVMDQFSKFKKLYPLKNQKLDSIIDALQVEYFSRIGIPNEILSDNGGQFITARWRDFANDIGFSVRKTSPYNPQSNPVERVMREIGRIIRVYAHDHQTTWDKIIDRAEKTINSTTHRSTGFKPVDLHPGVEEPLYVDLRLRPSDAIEEQNDQREAGEILNKRIETATQTLKKRAQQRKTQTDKHGQAEVYETGTKVWIKLHRRSDANRRLTKKIHLVYDGPHRIRREVRKNAYVVEDLEGNALGTFNSRQLKLHRETILDNQVEVNMIRTSKEIRSIEVGRIQNFAKEMQQSSEKEKVQPDEEVQILGAEQKSANSTQDDNRTSTSDGRSKRHPKRRKSLISEKEMRHVSRLIKLVSGGKQIPFFAGCVEGINMKVRFDHRGEFNVITSAAVKQIETGVRALERIRESTSIPAYLKREKRVKFKAVKVKMVIFRKTINVEAMILDGDEPCILIARLPCREVGGKMKEEEEDGVPLTR